MIGLLLVDGDGDVRARLRGVLDPEPDITVVGESACSAAVAGLVRTLLPDVVLMDARMPAVDGVPAVRHLLTTSVRPPRVLVLTTFGNDGRVYEALRAGAAGFLLRRARPVEIARAVRTVAQDDALLFPAAVRDLVATRGRTGVDMLRGAGLTEREAAVLRCVARGLTTAEIARELRVSADTVPAQVREMMTKLGARDRIQAVLAAYESGFIDPCGPPDLEDGYPSPLRSG